MVVFYPAIYAVQHQRPPRSHQIKRDLASSPSMSITAQVKRPSSSHHHQSQARYSPYGLQQSPAGAKRAQMNGDAAKAFWSPEMMMMNHHHHHQQQLAAAAAVATVAMGQQTNELLLPHLTSILQFKNQLAANGAFKHVVNNSQHSDQQSYSLNSSVNTSSGYGTMYESSGAVDTSSSTASESSSKSIAASAASLAHIMNWIKSTPSVESLKDVTTKIFYATVRWAKTQKNFLSLPALDQNSLLNENLTELFVLQMAESRFFSSELNSLVENEHTADEDKRQLLISLQNLLQKFQVDKVDPMEFYLLKSIALFKSEYKNVQEKSRIEHIQEECFMSLFNYNKLNYPTYPRFGRILNLYTELRRLSNTKLVEDFFLKKLLAKSDLSNVLLLNDLSTIQA